MVNSANTECLLCGALARGHFVLTADVRGFEGMRFALLTLKTDGQIARLHAP
jgi:hypothetical protein